MSSLRGALAQPVYFEPSEDPELFPVGHVSQDERARAHALRHGYPQHAHHYAPPTHPHAPAPGSAAPQHIAPSYPQQLQHAQQQQQQPQIINQPVPIIVQTQAPAAPVAQGALAPSHHLPAPPTVVVNTMAPPTRRSRHSRPSRPSRPTASNSAHSRLMRALARVTGDDEDDEDEYEEDGGRYSDDDDDDDDGGGEGAGRRRGESFVDGFDEGRRIQRRKQRHDLKGRASRNARAVTSAEGVRADPPSAIESLLGFEVSTTTAALMGAGVVVIALGMYAWSRSSSSPSPSFSFPSSTSSNPSFPMPQQGFVMQDGVLQPASLTPVLLMGGDGVQHQASVVMYPPATGTPPVPMMSSALAAAPSAPPQPMFFAPVAADQLGAAAFHRGFVGPSASSHSAPAPPHMQIPLQMQPHATVFMMHAPPHVAAAPSVPVYPPGFQTRPADSTQPAPMYYAMSHPAAVTGAPWARPTLSTMLPHTRGNPSPPAATT